VEGGAELAAFGARVLWDGEGPAPGLPAPEGNVQFFDSDYVVHNRAGFYASARAFSNRTIASECVNDEGIQFRDQADCVTIVSITGREFENIFPVLDYQRLPGTTEYQTGIPYACGDVVELTSTAFVGGVSDGWVGALAMDFNREHNTNVSIIWVGKSVVFLDDAVVSLGAGLGAIWTAGPVYTISTTVDQRLRAAPVNGSSAWFAHAGNASALQAVPQGGNVSVANLAWAWHGNVGYVMLAPAGEAAFVSSAVQNGSWAAVTQGPATPISMPVFSLGIDHGPMGAGVNATIAYVAVPNVTLPDMPAVFADVQERIQIVSNTRTEGDSGPGVQALCARGVAATNTSTVLALVAWPPLLNPFGPPGAILARANASAAGCVDVSLDVEGLATLRTGPAGFVSGAAVSIAIANPMGERHPLQGTLTVYGVQLDGAGCVATAGGDTTITVDFPSGPTAAESSVVVTCTVQAANR
jgi:Polysaccharide lyase family 8, super-sandwich domain